MIGFIATLILLHEPRPIGRLRLDPLGAGLLALGLASLTAGLSFGVEWGWTSPIEVAAILIAVLSLVGLIVVELRVSTPVVDIRLLRNRVFASANISLILSFLALFAVSFMLPFYLEELRGFSAEEAGLLLTPLPLTIAVIAPFSGTLADRIGTRWLASVGLGIACVGLLLISQLDAHSTLFDMIWRLLVIGLGQGLFQSPNNSALMGAAPVGRQGSAAGFLATGRVVGQSISVALAGAIFASLGGSSAGRILAGASAPTSSSSITLDPQMVAFLQKTFVDAFQTTFLVLACVAAIGVFTSLVRGKETAVKLNK
jgi:MFS family permease